MQDALELEFEGMIKAILRIKQKSIATFGEEFTLETSDVLRALINLLLPNDINIDKQLISFGLKILRKTIEVENKEHSNPASEWETEDWIMYK